MDDDISVGSDAESFSGDDAGGDEPTTEEILGYADFLGIDPETESDLMWIAREGVSAPVPPPWKACQNEESELFYWNPETQQSLWDHPADAHYQALLKEHRKKASGKLPGRQAPSEGSQGSGSPRGGSGVENDGNDSNSFVSEAVESGEDSGPSSSASPKGPVGASAQPNAMPADERVAIANSRRENDDNRGNTDDEGDHSKTFMSEAFSNTCEEETPSAPPSAPPTPANTAGEVRPMPASAEIGRSNAAGLLSSESNAPTLAKLNSGGSPSSARSSRNGGSPGSARSPRGGGSGQQSNRSPQSAGSEWSQESRGRRASQDSGMPQSRDSPRDAENQRCAGSPRSEGSVGSRHSRRGITRLRKSDSPRSASSRRSSCSEQSRGSPHSTASRHFQGSVQSGSSPREREGEKLLEKPRVTDSPRSSGRLSSASSARSGDRRSHRSGPRSSNASPRNEGTPESNASRHNAMSPRRGGSSRSANSSRSCGSDHGVGNYHNSGSPHSPASAASSRGNVGNGAPLQSSKANVRNMSPRSAGSCSFDVASDSGGSPLGITVHRAGATTKALEPRKAEDGGGGSRGRLGVGHLSGGRDGGGGHSARSSNMSEVSEDFRSDWGAPSPMFSARSGTGHSLEVSLSMEAEGARCFVGGVPISTACPTVAEEGSSACGTARQNPISWSDVLVELDALDNALQRVAEIRQSQVAYLRSLKCGD
eukprot:TRINITY_DN37192_c0_g1_i1.p1 TRINITY_DN37192_c0_g1~~TRINITY_DN37192_c0_g1_i1.p1  ORF type:complete len:739 (-),score=82.46 TRINITY_DN37192_c0_g1_i1:155-2284(-)